MTEKPELTLEQIRALMGIGLETTPDPRYEHEANELNDDEIILEALQRRTRRKVCVSCSGPFTPMRSHQRFCSKACKQKAYRSREALAESVTTSRCNAQRA